MSIAAADRRADAPLVVSGPGLRAVGGVAVPRRGGTVGAPGGATAFGRARLDGRESLLARLALPDHPCDLALAAAWFLAHGGDGLPALRGEFAFAVHDAATGTVSAVRDRFGVMPLFHARGSAGLAVGTDPGEVLRAADADPAADPVWAARFVAGRAGPPDRTAWAALRRVPPGHLLQLAARDVHGERAMRWFTPARPADADAHTVRHAGEAVGEALARAVSRRWVPGRTGTMLSGGLDSSTIAALARRGADAPVDAFSLDFTDPRLSERRYIDMTLAGGGFRSHRVDGDGARDGVAAWNVAPSIAYGIALTRRLYAAAAERGIDVLLDGHGGDEVVSHGHGRLLELAQRGRYRALWREVRGLAGTFSQGSVAAFAGVALRSGPAARTLARLPGGARARRFAAGLAGGGFDAAPLVRADLRDALADDPAPREGHSRDERDLHLRTLAQPLVADAFEALDAAARPHMVTPRYPFFDLDLVQLCLSLPGEAKLDGGWTRLPLRRAAAALLPADVAWRRSKTDFAPHFAARARALAFDADMERRLAPFVEIDRLRALAARVARPGATASGDDLAAAQAVWRAGRLAEWLRAAETAGREAGSEAGAEPERETGSEPGHDPGHEQGHEQGHGHARRAAA